MKPSKYTPDLAEFIGILIGDGFLSNSCGNYTIGIVGSPVTDKHYFLYVKKLIKILWSKDVRLVHRERGLRITFSSKDIFQTLVKEHKMPVGKKSDIIKIPEDIFADWNLAKHAIRGIFDTDGSIFTSNKPGSPNYPSIEITTSSLYLAKQIRELLLCQGFRVAKIWSYCSKLSKLTTYKIPLNGKANVVKWFQEIGSSNPYKYKRAERIIDGTAGI